ncbi:MAG TPA: MotA/TolQ/ExbB proton channel family protein [Polyangia bacterium]|nr:MotA/TolQ/ExbB proton channel family protein [Polyangia bacterium]
MDFTLVGLWHEMGFMARAVVVVLLAMSAYSLSIAVERAIAYRKGRALSRLYIEALAPMVESAARLPEAVDLHKRFVGAPVATVVGAGVAEYGKSLAAGAKASSAFDVAEAVNRTMERVKERELAGLRRGLPVLATVASSAPFVGLFGTVGGIITAFQKLADPTKGGGGIGTVSAGIAEALITTAVGLGVAILTVWFYNFFTARLDDITIDIDETASELVDSILKGHAA